jgi:Polyribonucleotide nucleotidyltransferase, RNA binding domain.
MGDRLRKAVRSPVKQEREAQTEALKAEVIAHFTADEPEEEIPNRTKEVTKAFEKLLKDGGSSRVDLQACKLGTGRRFTTS